MSKAFVAAARMENKRLYDMRMRTTYPVVKLSVERQLALPKLINEMMVVAEHNNTKPSRRQLCRDLEIGYAQVIQFARVANLQARHRLYNAKLNDEVLKMYKKFPDIGCYKISKLTHTYYSRVKKIIAANNNNIKD